MSAPELVADGPELALPELADRDPAPPIRGADHGRAHQLEHGPLLLRHKLERAVHGFGKTETKA